MRQVDQQSYGLASTMTPYQFEHQGRCDALLAVLGVHGQRVDVVFARLRFIEYAREVAVHLLLDRFEESPSQRMQVGAIVADDDAGDVALRRLGNQCVAVTVLAVVTSH